MDDFDPCRLYSGSSSVYDYGTWAAARLLVEHGVWIKRADFRETCVRSDDSGVWISWCEAEKLLNQQFFPASASEIAILKLATSLALDTSGFSGLSVPQRQMALNAITVALGLSRPAVTQ